MKMRNLLMAAAAVFAFAACTSEDLVNEPSVAPNTGELPISFTVKNKNTTRGVQKMEETGHYNFGVWAYKQTDNTAGAEKYQTVMDNYLVGWKDDAATGFKGYNAISQTQGASNSLTDATSLWIYENLGKAQYKNTANDYYKYDLSAFPAVTTDEAYMSNNDNQYLKFWDYSAKQVEFYAYAPYVNGTAVTITNPHAVSNTTITFPTVTAGTVGSLNDYMVAAPVVRKPTDAGLKYNDDVPLTFTRLTSQVRLAFYEVIEGYDVEMIDYATGKEVAANGNIVTSATNVTYNYTTGAVNWNSPTAAATEILFNKPVGNAVTADTYHKHGDYNQIANRRDETIAENPLTIGCLHDPNSQSPTTYYCLPSSTNGDLTFHVSFNLHSLDTDEVIEVKDATVVIPEAYTRWTANTVYTYIFKITKNANGGTGGDGDPKGLYPIVFDGIEVTDMATNQSEWVISQVSLSKKMITLTSSGTTTVDAVLDYVTGSPASTEVTWASSDENVATVTTSTTATGDPLKATATITAVKAGKATITATNVGTTGECIVAVPLQLSASTLSLSGAVGTTGSVSATNIVTGDEANVTWTSSNPAVATVTSGQVTSVAAGTAVITAQYKGVVASCTVTVTIP